MAKGKKTNSGRQPTNSSKKSRSVPPKATWQVLDQLAVQFTHRTNQHSLLNLNDDSNGEVAWRNHERPRTTIEIPSELLLVGDRQEQEYNIISRKHSAFVFPLHETTDNVFGIWGSPEQVNATTQALTDWITRERTSNNNNSTSKFGSVQTFTPQQRERAQRRWSKEVFRYRFRQAPPSGTGFEAIGAFTWPDEVDIEEALGRSLEVLDPVRMECSCHIIKQDDSKHSIEVLGDMDDVEQALLRIRCTYFQLAARQCAATRQYLLDSVGETVTLHEYVHTCRLQPATFSQPRPPGRAYRNDEWCQDRDDCASEQLGSTLVNNMMHIIKGLHYLRANICFNIRCGAFLAVQHMEPTDGSYSQDEFQTMIMQSQFIGETTEEIGDKAVEDSVLHALQQSDGLLLPHDVKHNNLTTIEPVYEAIFTFKEAAVDLQLTLTWEEDVLSSRKWAKAQSTKLIDINLLNLNFGTAWHFDMRSSQSIDEARIPTPLINFANRVKFDSEAARKFKANAAFISILPLPSLRSMRLHMIHRYQYKSSDYILEVRRYQHRDYARSPSAMRPSVTAYEPRVALSVLNPNWAKMLIKNDRLAVGQRTKWSDNSSDWFPRYDAAGKANGTDEGLAHLLTLLRETEAVIRPTDSRFQIDEHTGMTIG